MIEELRAQIQEGFLSHGKGKKTSTTTLEACRLFSLSSLAPCIPVSDCPRARKKKAGQESERSMPSVAPLFGRGKTKCSRNTNGLKREFIILEIVRSG